MPTAGAHQVNFFFHFAEKAKRQRRREKKHRKRESFPLQSDSPVPAVGSQELGAQCGSPMWESRIQLPETSPAVLSVCFSKPLNGTTAGTGTQPGIQYVVLPQAASSALSPNHHPELPESFVCVYLCVYTYIIIFLSRNNPGTLRSRYWLFLLCRIMFRILLHFPRGAVLCLKLNPFITHVLPWIGRQRIILLCVQHEERKGLSLYFPFWPYFSGRFRGRLGVTLRRWSFSFIVRSNLCNSCSAFFLKWVTMLGWARKALIEMVPSLCASYRLVCLVKKRKCGMNWWEFSIRTKFAKNTFCQRHRDWKALFE